MTARTVLPATGTWTVTGMPRSARASVARGGARRSRAGVPGPEPPPVGGAAPGGAGATVRPIAGDRNGRWLPSATLTTSWR